MDLNELGHEQLGVATQTDGHGTRTCPALTSESGETLLTRLSTNATGGVRRARTTERKGRRIVAGRCDAVTMCASPIDAGTSTATEHDARPTPGRYSGWAHQSDQVCRRSHASAVDGDHCQASHSAAFRRGAGRVPASVQFIAIRAIDGSAKARGERDGNCRSAHQAGRVPHRADGRERLSWSHEDGATGCFAGSPAGSAAFDLVGEVISDVELLFKGREQERGSTVTTNQVLVGVGHGGWSLRSRQPTSAAQHFVVRVVTMTGSFARMDQPYSRV
jgi:hypothetical protein